MFNKKFTFVLITLIFMLSISMVSAVDTNTTDDMLIGDLEEEPPSYSLGDNSSDENITNEDNNFVLNASDVEMYYKNGTNYTLILYQNASPVCNASIDITVNGIKYNKTTDDDGKISIPIDLNVGNYIITASYNNLTSLKSNIKVLSLVVSKDLVKTYKSTTKFYASFLTSTGQALKNTNVKFKINGKIYTKKTDSKGIASININLKVGQYTIYAMHPNGFSMSYNVIVKHSITTSNVNKHYKSSKKFTAVFYGISGKVLKNKKVSFKINNKKLTKKTNSKGVVKLTILSKPGSYKIISINPVTGEKVSNTIKVSKTISAKKKLVVYSATTSEFKVKLYKNDKLVKNAKVYVYIKGHKKTYKTDKDGIANVKFKLAAGSYIFKSKDPYTGYTITSKIKVKLSTIRADNVFAKDNMTGEFKATLFKQTGKVAKKTKMQITIGGVKQIVKTNSRGVATLKFKLPEGSYNVVCKDLSTGFVLTKKIVVLKVGESKLYNKYGVSEDGKTILAIGRASASGEMSKYGYSFYQTEFLRICPYCGSDELYWGIFWAGSETADYGVFPATGHKEGGSAEGHIFCAHCDCDWSVFGHNHGTGGDLTIVCSPIHVTKETAYLLKSGTYVYP